MHAWITFSKSDDDIMFIIFPKAMSWKELALTTEFICLSNEKLPSKRALDFSRALRSTLREERGSEGLNNTISVF